jgi:hypothetical protein
MWCQEKIFWPLPKIKSLAIVTSQLGEGVLVVKINAPSPYEMVDWFNYFTANFGF